MVFHRNNTYLFAKGFYRTGCFAQKYSACLFHPSGMNRILKSDWFAPAILYKNPDVKFAAAIHRFGCKIAFEKKNQTIVSVISRFFQTKESLKIY